MFGIGRKAKTDVNPDFTHERLGTLLELHKRYPGVIPPSGVKVTDLALAIAMDIAVRFHEVVFEGFLIQEVSIERDFPLGWTRADALSRWYALGLICLTRCSMTSIWNNALTVEVGTQVYDASVEFIWFRWPKVPGPVKERVRFFMGQNIQSITSSLRVAGNGEMNPMWFRRYATRLKGCNPPWGTESEGWRSGFGDEYGGETISKDVQLNRALTHYFYTATDSVMKLVRSADPLALVAAERASQTNS